MHQDTSPIKFIQMVRIQPLRLRLSPLSRFIFQRQGQTLLTAESINAFVIIPPALPFQQDMHPAVTIVNTGFNDFLYAQAQRTVV